MARDSENTPVDVRTIFTDKTWDNLLSGIAVIHDKNFADIKNALKTQRKASEQQGIDEEIRSINAERNNRAVNNALFGKLDKQVSIMDKLTDCLKEIGEHILDMLKDMAKQSLRSYDEAIRGQRQQLLTTKQIKENTLKADHGRAYLEKKGIKINTGEISSLLPELTALGEDINTISKEQLANMALLKKTAGVDTKTALLLARSFKNQEAFTKFATNASDTTGRATTAAILSQINEAWFQRVSIAFGGQEKMLTTIQNTAKSMDAMLGHYGLSADSQKNLINTTLKLASGQIEKAKEDEIASALMISGDAMRSPEKLLAGLENLITNQNMSMSQKLNRLRVLEGVEGIDQSIIDAVTAAIKAQEEGTYKKKSIRSEEDNKEAINQAQKGGRLGGFIDSLISGVNIATGGVLSDLSATLNEYFGENASMEAIVSTGFKMVVGILTTIVVSQLIGNPLKLIGRAISKGILSSAGSVLARLGAGLATKLAPLLVALGPIAAALATIAAAVGVGTAFYRWSKRRDNDKEAKINAETELAQLKEEIEFKKRLLEMPNLSQVEKTKIENELTELEARLPGKENKAAIQAHVYKLKDDEAQEFMDMIPSLYRELYDLAQKQKLRAAVGMLSPELEKQIQMTITKINVAEEYTRSYFGNMDDLEEDTKNRVPSATLNQGAFDAFKAYGYDTSMFEHLKQGSAYAKAVDNINNGVSKLMRISASSVDDVEAARMHDDDLRFVNFLTKSFNEYKQNNQLSTSILSAFSVQASKALGYSGLSKEATDKLIQFKDTLAVEAQALTVQKDSLNILKDINKNISDNTAILAVKPFAKGGVVDKATPSLVGEAGKEAILPLTHKNDLARVLMSLNNDEKLNILKAILGHPSVRSTNGIFAMLERILFNKFSFGQYKQQKTTQQKTQPQDSQQLPTIPDGTFAPGDDPDTINKILSYASPEYRNILAQKLIDGRKKRKKWFDESLANASNTSGRELIKGTYAERALAAGVSQLGKPYILRSLGNIGYVCNELTDYAMRKSGFDMKDFHIYSVRQTFSNLVNGRTGTIKRGDRKGQKKEFPEFRLRPDLTPETAPPGMVFFSKKNKDALPGHIGLVYYNHKILHSSGGSSNYTPGGFLEGWQIPCRGVSVTDFNKSQHYEFGEFPGLFEKANGEFAGDINASFGPMAELSKTKSNLDTQLEEQQRMAKEAMNAVIANTSGEVRKAAMQYAEQAMKLLDGKNTKEVIDSLGRIIQYLRSIATSTKPPTPNVSRAPVVKY